MKKEWKIPAPWPFLLLLASIIILGASCGIVNKDKKSTTETFDSSAVQVSNKSVAKEQDSTGKKSVEKTEEEKQTDIDSSGLRIKLNPVTDPSKITGPIQWGFDTSGMIAWLDPGGRDIESIDLSKQKKTVNQKTTKQAGTDSSHVVSSFQVSKSDSSNIQVNKKVVSTEKKVFRFQLPWYAYLVGVLLAVGIWQFWPYLRKPKKGSVLPYNSPKDNKA